mgnify:CR=1 FL=1
MSMEYLVNAEEMRSCDNATIEKFKVPAIVLMERAALGVFEVIEDYWKKDTGNVLIVAGTGNNGADGIALGRLLKQAGFEVTFLVAGPKEKYSELMDRQHAIIEAYGWRSGTQFPENEYDIIIDALFGIGLSRNLEGIYMQFVQKINDSNALKISVDMPSGIHTDTGAVMGTAVRADVTVTFAYCKLGLVLYPGAEYAGTVVVKDIGITQESFCFEGKFPEVFTLSGKAAEFLPERKKDGNKGTFGKVLVIAGNEEISGACLLSAEAAFRTGCGMVRILTHRANREILAQKLPEAMLNVYDTKESGDGVGENLRVQLEKGCEWADCILLGPGCGVGKETEEKLAFVIEKCEKPLVIDADGLNQIAQDSGLYHSLKKSVREQNRAVILTPHLGEFARLTKKTVPEIKKNLLEEVKTYAEDLGGIIVCKDVRTVVCAKDRRTFLNRSGNCGMATAGSGDVLAGMIAGLLAQAVLRVNKTGAERAETEKGAAFEAAVTGVYLHGLAGEAACKEKNEYSLLAGDLIGQFDILFRSE